MPEGPPPGSTFGAPEAPPKKAPSKPLVASKGDDEQILKDVMALHSDAAKDRLNYEGMWSLCQAFYEGQQYVKWQETSRTLSKDDKVPPWRVRVTHNRIRPTIDQVVSILSADQPILSTRPASGDFEDQGTAEITSGLLTYLKDHLRFLDVDRIVKKWKAICGTAAIEVVWDPEAGEVLPVPATDPITGQPVFGPDGQPQMQTDDLGKPIFAPSGDIRLLFRTSFETYVDPSANGPEDANYIIVSTMEDPKAIERQFGVELGDQPLSGGAGSTPTASIGTRFGTLLNRVRHLFGPQPNTKTGFGTPGASTGIEVVKIYLAPSRDEPGGRCILVAGNKVLYDDVCQTRGKFRFPVFFFHHRKHGKRPWGDGIVQDLLDIQREVNRTISQIIEQRNLHVKPKWLVPSGCGLKKTQITSEPGEVLEYDAFNAGDPKPEQIEAINIPPSLFNFLNVLMAEFDRISGINEASRGEVPTGVKSGKGLELLQQQNTQRLSTVQATDYEVWRDIGSYLLHLVKEYWPDGKVISVVGRDMKPVLIDFKKATLDKPVDVIVENNNALPQNKIDRLNFLSTLFQPQGPMVMLPPEQRKQYLSLLQFADVQKFIRDESVHEAKARRQYRLCVSGVPQQARYNDHHETHRRVLAELMALPDFDEVPPEFQMLVENLDREHAAFLTGTMPNPAQAGMTPEQMQAQNHTAAMGSPKSGSPPKPNVV